MGRIYSYLVLLVIVLVFVPHYLIAGDIIQKRITRDGTIHFSNSDSPSEESPQGKRPEWPRAQAPANAQGNIAKTNGTLDKERKNDLEELCKDWFYYRKKIRDAVREGDKATLSKQQAVFGRVNFWLKEYNERDVQDMLIRVEKISPFAR